MTNTELSKNYWRYYLMLEKKFLETVEYVEIHTDNYHSFSNEFAMLLQAIGAELDNVFKVYCGYNLTDRDKNISHYATFILSDYPGIKTQIVKVRDRDIDLIPFQNWVANPAAQSLTWWQAFDDIKHNRCGNVKEGNQENVLNMLAALYLVEMKLYKKLVVTDQNGKPTEPDVPAEGSKIFTLENWANRYSQMGEHFALVDGRFCICYETENEGGTAP